MNDEPNKIDTNEGNVQPNEVLKSNTPSDIPIPHKLNSRIYNGAKKIGNLAKKFVKKFGKMAVKVIAKLLSHPAVLAIVVVIIFFIIIVVFIINNFKLTTTKNSISNGTKKVMNSWNEEALTEQQKLAKNSYEKTGSLLDFTIPDIEKMVSDIEEKKNSLQENTDEWKLYNSLLTKTGSENVTSSARIVSTDDKVSIYEHMLLISKYDFNNVKWKRYGHGFNGEDSPLKEDYELGVKYPTDQSNTKYETFSSLLKPYLLSYEVPVAFYSGLVDNEYQELKSDTAFPYSILKNALSDITVNRYDVQKYTLVTNYWVYDYTNYQTKFDVSLTQNQDGSIAVNMTRIVQEAVGSGSEDTSRDGDGTYNVMNEKEYSSATTYDNKYYISTAKIFDYKIENEYKYIAYSESDTKARVNFDSEQREETPYSEIINENNKIDTYFTYTSNDSIDNIIKQIENTYGVTCSPESHDGTYTFVGSQYQVREGSKWIVTRSWSDTLSQSSSTSNYYSIDDVISYNENCSAGTVSSDDFNADTASVEYYNKLDEKKKLNRIDFMNSNPNIFNQYIRKKSYEKYVGISRQNLDILCYNSLTELWQTLENDYGSFPYQYGKTLGFQSSSSSTTSTFSGMDLLKRYLRSREGHEGLADENGNKLSDDALDEATYYIVGPVWNGKKYTRTVGYGVDLDTSGYEEEIKAAMGRTENFVEGDLIPIEIVDKCEEDEIQKAINDVEGEFSGIELKEYQIHALVSRYYNCGASGWKWAKYSDSGKTIVESYNTWWNEEEDDQFETLYEEYKDNQEAKSEIVANADYTNEFYKDIMSHPTNDGLLTTRRESEWILFSMGYYDSLKVFWSQGSATPGNVNLYNSDKTVNEDSLVELTNWYIDNFFSGSDSMRLPGYGGSVHVYDHSVLNTAEYSSLLNNGLGEFQCTWWARIRASYYAWSVDPSRNGNNIFTSGNGKDVASQTSGHYGVLYNTNVEEIKENSIVSLTSSSGYGHVAYVEAVDYINRCYYTSECGRGDDPYGFWYGIKKRSFDSGGFIGSVSLDDIMNSSVYQGGN